MGGQRQAPQDVGGFVHRNERLLVAEGHALTEVLHVEMRAHVRDGLPPDIQLVAAQGLVLARRLGHGETEMEVGVLELIVLLTGRAHPAGSFGSGVLTMQATRKVQCQCQASAAGGTGQQHGVRQGSLLGVARQPLGQRVLSDRLHEPFCHAPKIAGFTRLQDANANPPGSPGPAR